MHCIRTKKTKKHEKKSSHTHQPLADSCHRFTTDGTLFATVTFGIPNHDRSWFEQSQIFGGWQFFLSGCVRSLRGSVSNVSEIFGECWVCRQSKHIIRDDTFAASSELATGAGVRPFVHCSGFRSLLAAAPALQSFSVQSLVVVASRQHFVARVLDRNYRVSFERTKRFQLWKFRVNLSGWLEFETQLWRHI